jgi:anti-sigma B factor antagonist
MALLTFTHTIGTALVFELHGVLDGATADKLELQVMQALDEGRRLLLFDLEKLTFVSSPGLRIFLAAYRRLQGTGHVRFARLQDRVRQVFNLTGLTARLEIYDTVADALVGPAP